MTQRADGVYGVGFLFGGAGIGVLSAVTRIYYRQKVNNPKTQQQIAVETLAKIAKDRLKLK